MTVALFLVFTNPLTYPPLLYLWTFAGFLGGLIAGGKIRRGFLVGMTVYLSTLGALGLAALAIYQNVNLSTLSSLPPPPPGFSIISATTGPVAGDIIPILIQGASPTSQMIIQDVILTMIRNAGLVFAVATISGRAASLFWQGDVFILKTVWKTIKTKKPNLPQTNGTSAIPKKEILLLALAILFLIPTQHTTQPSTITQAPPSGPYQQNLGIGLDMLGAPNASLQMTNLDLSSKGLVLDNNYAVTRVLGLLPSSSFSTLIKPANLQTLQYFAAIGLASISLPAPLNKTPTQAFSFILNTQFPRQFYKAGQHYLSLKTLLGFQTGIVGDTNSNASIVSISFQRGTVLYSPLGLTPPYNPIYN